MVATVKPLMRSFAGGEITPELFGRLDLDKFQTGVARALNFWVLPHGPLQNRPGTNYVLHVKDSTRRTRVIAFAYSSTQTMVLEFGHHYIRFHTAGATLLETVKTITSVTQASPGVFTKNSHGYSNGDWVQVLGAGGMTTLNYRFYIVANVTTNTYTLTTLTGEAVSTSALPAYTGGGTTGRVYTVTTTYDEAHLFDLHVTQDADVLTIVHPSYAPMELRRLGATNWTLTAASFSPTVLPPTSVLVKPTTITFTSAPAAATSATLTTGFTGETGVRTVTFSDGTKKAVTFTKDSAAVTWAGAVTATASAYYVPTIGAKRSKYVVTSILADGSDESLPSTVGLGESLSGWSITSANPAVLSNASAHGLNVDDDVYISFVNGGEHYTGEFLVNTVPSSTSITLKTLAGAVLDNSGGLIAGTGTVSSVGVLNDLSVTPNSNTLNWTVASSVDRYNVYKEKSGLYGYVGQSDGVSFVDDNITPDMTKTPPTSYLPFASAGNYPGAVSHISQRRCFAGTDNNPQHAWMTKPGTEGNLRQSVPIQDDDPIIFRIKAAQQNRIRHLVPLGELIALTAGGEFLVRAADGSGVLTPASVDPKPQSFIGASNVQPVVAENAILYAQARGSHMREFAYGGDGVNGALYRANDISLLAPHLFDGYTIVDIAYQNTSTLPIVWVVRSDGRLLGMTYVPGQNVRAWHQHDTDGLFESACCVDENDESVRYDVVQRTIGGNTVRYIERLHTRAFSDKEDAFFVDAGGTYEGSPTTTITRLWHLIGETVSALADGAVIRNLVVDANGTVTLPAEASVVHVGLPITSNVRTLPLSWQTDGFGQGLIKNVSKVHLRLSNSSGIHIGPTDGDLVEVKQRTTEPFGSPPGLINGWKHVNIKPMWQDDGGIEIEQTDPLPVTVLAMVLDVVAGG